MKVALSFDLLRSLETLRADRGRDDIEVRHDAFMLFGGLGTAVYLTRSGEFLALSNFDTSDGLREATDSEATSALVICARRTGMEELLSLLPARPDGSTTCTECSGSRWSPLRSSDDKWPVVVCTSCSGLGWS